MEMAKGRVRMRVVGLVQGVYFRANTRQQARQVGLTGWVRNCPDSSVEVVAEGDREALENLVAWCHQGPLGAVVERVEVSWEPYQGEFTGFFIAY